mgnify:CR=1 FL=1
MRIALISDIHANEVALKAVLKDIGVWLAFQHEKVDLKTEEFPLSICILRNWFYEAKKEGKDWRLLAFRVREKFK